MEQTNFLADTFEPESFIFSKPKKYKNGELMLCKVKNKHSENVLIQFPKMTVGEYSKHLELEFINQSGYNLKVCNFLAKLDDFVMEHISLNSEKWFDKKIETEQIKHMYLRSIKENTLKFIFDKNNSQLIDKRNEPLELSEITKGTTLECICQLKYIVFTKDSSFLHWEICTAKIHKKICRVPQFGFIEDATDISDTECEESVTFF